MTTLHKENLETLRDDFCCEYGRLFAEKVGGLLAPYEPEKTTPQTMEFLHEAGLQEEYLL
jgi:hypothetical protein